MKQDQSIKYQDEVRSRPLNKRFLDYSKASVLRGFDLRKGKGNFSLSLVRGLSLESAAVSPSGVKITEYIDLNDVLQITPNPDGVERVDAVYLKYEYGRKENVGEYVVVEGVDFKKPLNPNPATHLLLGWVFVPPNKRALSENSFQSVPKGVKIPELIGDTIFTGDLKVDGNVIITGDLDSNIKDEAGVIIERLPRPILAKKGQRDFETHKPYMMNKNTLFVYVNDHLLMPEEIMEVTPTTFKINKTLNEGDRVWAYWFVRIKLIRYEEHDHDDRYYTKEEVDRRMVIYDKGKFKGMSGEVITHNLNGMDYSVVGVVPTEKTTSVGDISVAKADDHIYVYNSGSYRGSFDISYILNNDDDTFPEGIGSIYKVSSEEIDSGIGAYKRVRRMRKNGSLHSISRLIQPDKNGLYNKLEIEFYDYKGEKVITKRSYRLIHDDTGRVTGTEREV